MWQRTLRIWKLNLSGAKRQSQTPGRVLLAETKIIGMNLWKILFRFSSENLSPNPSSEAGKACKVPLLLWMSGLHRTVLHPCGCRDHTPLAAAGSCLSSSGCSEPPAQGCYLLPESLLPQGNILPPRPSTEKCSSNHRFQSSACWDPKLIHFLWGRTWQQPRQQPPGRRASGLSFGGQQLLYLWNENNHNPSL